MNLQQKYNREDFLEFLKTFVPNFTRDISNVVPNGLQVTKEAFYLGKSEELDLEVFELTHSSSADARVAMSMDGFRIMKNSATYRALVIYKAEKGEDWRLSLMTATPGINEKGKVGQSFSNPRRFSFFLGPNAKINTPYQFLIKQGAVKNFEDLQNRFSLEVVNKAFYKEISENFTKLVGGINNNKTYTAILSFPSTEGQNHASSEFAVRLIGRIIFCWFLREKKGASGTSLMPKELLSLEAIAKHSDYYHQILESIFFEVLNKEIKSRGEPYVNEPFSFIPYLNGGLFSPHEDDYYRRRNGEKSLYHDTLVIPDAWFIDFFRVLETYNFTIDENTSFDEELSIDPEMLGRIFENLLAEINPETGESARKSTGSYYTPRVIVDYMVDESLLLYLRQQTNIEENKLKAVISYDLSDDVEQPLGDDEKQKIIDALGKLKLLDPACGSGAFPIGALQKIVFILQQIDQNGQLWLHAQVKNSPPEIRRVIEREFAHKNFDYIRKLGVIRENIYGVDIQPIATEISRLRCFLTLVVDERIDDSLENRGIEPLPNLDFKFVTANSLIGLPLATDKSQTGLFEDDNGIKDLKEIRNMFFNASGSERDRFKLQFVQVQNRMFQRLITEGRREHAELTTKLTSWDPFSNKTSLWFDPEWMFGISNDFDIVIGNPPYVNIRKIDKDIKNAYQHLYSSASGQYDLYILFIEKSLSLLRKNGYVSLITPNKFLISSYGKNIRKIIAEKTILKDFVDHSRDNTFDGVGVYPVVFLLENQSKKIEINDDYNLLKIFNFERRDLVLEKLDKVEKTLIDYCFIKEAIHTGNIREKLIVSEKINSNSFPLLRGKDCDRYTISWKNLYINYDYHPQKDLGEYASLIDKEYFLNEKLFLREIALRPSATYDNEGYFCLNKAYVVGQKDKNINLKYILGLLNSKLIAYFFEKKFGDLRVGGGYLQFKKQFTSKIPILIGDNSFCKEIVDLVNQILSIKKLDSKVNTSDLEGRIDQLVYRLYDLTTEEIEIVENSSKNE